MMQRVARRMVGTLKARRFFINCLKGLPIGVLALSASLTFGSSNIIKPGDVWLDNRGLPIEAHGGGILLYKGTYFWFGEDHATTNDPTKRYLSCYSSKDLVHWKFRRQVFSASSVDRISKGLFVERPKVYYNVKTHEFVLYAHLGGSHDGPDRILVAVSNKVDGKYSYAKSFSPLGEVSRDIGQFVDDDGTAYLIFESTNGFFIARLTDDYMNVKRTCFIQVPLDAGALVHYNGLYYVVGAHMTGWLPNPDVYATAPSIDGPWTEFRNIAPPETNTYGSQSTFLLKVKGTNATTVIFMGDIWKPKALWDSRYIWMPVEIGDGKLNLPAPHPWTLDVTTGEAKNLP